jgi:hypothetical protein
MNRNHRFGVAVALGCVVAAAFSSITGAVEVNDLKGSPYAKCK